MEAIRVAVDIAPLGPQIVLAVGGLLLLLLSLRRESEAAAPYVSLAVLGATAWVCVSWWSDPPSAGPGMLALDRFAILFDLILLGAAAAACLLSAVYFHAGYDLRSEYYSLLLFCTLGMTVMTGSRDFVSLFLGLEIFSLCFYLLSAYARGRATALESAMKYFLLGAFSSGFLLYGMALVYGATRTLDLERVRDLLVTRQASPSLTLFAGLALLLVGFGFKIGIAPFHFWIPDVYEGAPAAVTAFMAAATKVAAFAGLLRVLHVGFGDPASVARWAPLLGLLAALTMTTANVVALAQRNLKRLLAYSSIAHAGYVLLAVATGTMAGVESVVFYLLAYVAANLGAFSVAVLVGRSQPDREEGYRLDDLVGLGRRRPAMAAAMTAFMLSLTGIPPTAGFLGKWFIFKSALDAHLLGLAIVLAVNSAIAAYYYLGVVARMYMTEETGDQRSSPVPIPLAISAGIAVAAVFYLGLFPDRILALVNEMALKFWGPVQLI